jgi:hypothetical protein
VEHALGVRDLPVHHADPFDRILIAQAIHEDLTIVTLDSAIEAYDVRTMDASEQSLVPESDRRIHPHGPARGDSAAERRGRDQYHRHRAERQRIGRRHSDQDRR